MKCKVTVEITVDGNFKCPSEARDLIETELSFPEELWNNQIKDIDYVNVEVINDVLDKEEVVKC